MADPVNEVEWFKRCPTGSTVFVRPNEPTEQSVELPPEEARTTYRLDLPWARPPLNDGGAA